MWFQEAGILKTRHQKDNVYKDVNKTVAIMSGIFKAIAYKYLRCFKKCATGLLAKEGKGEGFLLQFPHIIQLSRQHLGY
jgi:hypothetical protein